MAKIAIVSDTTADIPEDMRRELDIHMVDAFVTMGTEVFVLGDMDLDDFYDRMERSDESNFPKTSQPRASDLLEQYEKLKSLDYQHILSIHVTATLSGTLNSANVAKGMIDDIDIRIIDSQGVTANLIAVLVEARRLVDAGLEIDEVVSQLNEYSSKITSYITLKSMDNLVKGGRISKMRYFMGRLLNIKPILKLGQKKLEAHGKARGVQNSRETIYKLATKAFNKNQEFRYIVAHTRELEDALRLEKRLQAEFPKAKGFVIEIGIVVAVHGGPGGMLVLCYD